MLCCVGQQSLVWLVEGKRLARRRVGADDDASENFGGCLGSGPLEWPSRVALHSRDSRVDLTHIDLTHKISRA